MINDHSYLGTICSGLLRLEIFGTFCAVIPVTDFHGTFSLPKKPEAHLDPYQISVMDIFCENSQRFLAITYFSQKGTLWMFKRVLNSFSPNPTKWSDTLKGLIRLWKQHRLQRIFTSNQARTCSR